MRARTAGFVVAAVVGAAVFCRLGVWQLGRLHEREARNAGMMAHLAEPPVSVDSAVGSVDSLRYRRARVTGVPDYSREALLVQRTRDGSPGVYLVTPVHTPGSDSVTIVVRGWVYAPDGVRADQARWREGDRLTMAGWLEELPSSGASPLAGQPAAVRRLDRADLARRAGAPVRAMYLWAVEPAAPVNAAPGSALPARFTLPVLDDGPHRSYAIQWFSFAAIALIGAGVFVRSDRQQDGQPERGADSPATTF